MQWENLTAKDFEKTMKKTGVCILPIGVIEKHGEHLPLGTDYLLGHKMACRAAEKESAVVFPHYYFGQITEARCYPGTVAVKPDIMINLLQNVLDEIGRNGFKKIIILDAHGGNPAFLKFLLQSQLNEEKPYTVYYTFFDDVLDKKARKKWEATLKTKLHYHACECETSCSLDVHPEIVKMKDVIKKPGDPLNRMSHITAGFTPLSWYADHPAHYAGDARAASAEKGKILNQLLVDGMAKYIRAVKKDKVAPALQREFFRKVKKVEKGEAYK